MKVWWYVACYCMFRASVLGMGQNDVIVVVAARGGAQSPEGWKRNLMLGSIAWAIAQSITMRHNSCRCVGSNTFHKFNINNTIRLPNGPWRVSKYIYPYLFELSIIISNSSQPGRSQPSLAYHFKWLRIIRPPPTPPPLGTPNFIVLRHPGDPKRNKNS